MATDAHDVAPNTLEGWDQLPAFPEGLPCGSINSISHAKLCAGNIKELEHLLWSARTTGFFRVDLCDTEQGRRFLNGANNMFKLANETFNLPADVKLADNMLNHGDALLG